MHYKKKKRVKMGPLFAIVKKARGRGKHFLFMMSPRVAITVAYSSKGKCKPARVATMISATYLPSVPLMESFAKVPAAVLQVIWSTTGCHSSCRRHHHCCRHRRYETGLPSSSNPPKIVVIREAAPPIRFYKTENEWTLRIQ